MRALVGTIGLILAVLGCSACGSSEATPNARRGVPPTTDSSARPAAAAAALPPATAEPSDANPLTRAAVPAGTIRMGRAVESDGRVPDAESTDVFMTSDPIHLSLEAAELAAGELTIHDENGAQVWSDREIVAAGKAYLNFAIKPGGLRPGHYRATVSTESGQLDTHRFAVSEG